MNREIKFRGINPYGLWFYGSLYINEKGECFIDRNNWQREPVIKESVGQYTGLKDQNGKNIFEGDIVKAYKPNSYLNGVFEVRWNESEGAWRYWDGKQFMFSVQAKMYNIGNFKSGARCEIIGNIYENPELLKQQ